eukprot:m.84507 g.84507  ORF g.84507 m.84507 type:complete len:148 (+) comp36410_c0_seq18:295-738(+)
MRAWKRFSVTLLVGCSPVQVAKKFYPGGWVGEDREGSPVFYDPIGKADFRGLLHSMKRSDILKLQLHGGEVALRKCQEQSKKLGQLISTIVLVFDMEGFSIRNHLWKPVIGVMMESFALLEANYPELLKHLFVVNGRFTVGKCGSVM